MPSRNTKKKEIAVTPPGFKSKIGAVLRAYRKSAKLTQEQVAEMIGIAHYQVSRYERGLDAPSLWMLTKFAAVFEVTPLQLLKEILT